MLKTQRLIDNTNLMSILIFGYYVIFGTYVALAYEGAAYEFLLSSVVLSALVVVLRSTKTVSPIFRTMGDVLFVVYIALLGPASYFILKSDDLLFFACMYMFAISVFWIRDPDRIKKATSE